MPKVATNPENTLDPAVAATVVPIPPPEAFAAQAAISGMAGYHALCAQAEADYEGFWAERAREQLSWSKPFSTVLNERDAPFFTWFEDGELNASYNCLDRNVEDGKGDKVAIRFEADDVAVTTVTYHELLAKVCRLANGLQSLGVTRGRSRRHIYAYGDVDRRHRRDAGLRPHRRDPFGGVRRPLFGDNLPKTRSGKIMRRLLRSIAKGETITQDTRPSRTRPSLNSSRDPVERWQRDDEAPLDGARRRSSVALALHQHRQGIDSVV